MALETRPIPELTGQAAIDFHEKVKNFTIKETREEILEGIRWVRREMDRQRREPENRRTAQERLIEFYGEANAGTAQDDSPTETYRGKPSGKEVW
jgi:hypothetical protein